MLKAQCAVAGEVETHGAEPTPRDVMSLFGLGSLGSAATYISENLGETLSFTSSAIPKGNSAPAKSLPASGPTSAVQKDEAGPPVSGNVDPMAAISKTTPASSFGAPQATSGAAFGGGAPGAESAADVAAGGTQSVSGSRTGEQPSGGGSQKDDDLTRALKMVGNTLSLSQYLPKALQSNLGGAFVPDLIPAKVAKPGEKNEKKDGDADKEDTDREKDINNVDPTNAVFGKGPGANGDGKDAKDKNADAEAAAKEAKEKEDQKAAQEKKEKEEEVKQEKLKDLLTAPFKDNEKTDVANYHLLSDAFEKDPRGVLKLLDRDPGARGMAEALVQNFGENGKIIPDNTNRSRADRMSGMLRGTIPDTGSFTGAPSGRGRPTPLGTGGPRGPSHNNADPKNQKR